MSVGSPKEPADPVVASVGETSIAASDVLERIGEMPPEAQGQYRQSPEALRRLLQQMIEEQQILAIAHKRGYQHDPRHKRAMRRHLIKLIHEDVLGLVTLDKITTADARGYYNEHRAEFSSRTLLRARQIVVADEAQAKALAAQAKGASEARFAALARQHSIDATTRARGGDLGRFSQAGGPVTEVVYRIALGLHEPGAIGGPVKSARGWHVIRLTEHVAAVQHPFDKVELQAKIAAMRHKRELTLRQFRREAEQLYRSTRDPKALDKLRAQIRAE